MLEEFQLLDLKHFQFEQIRIDSQALKNNPLGDPNVRINPIMVPKNFDDKKLGLVIVLAGFTGNGPKYLGPRTFEDNFAQLIDKLVAKKKAPKAVYLFVDAFSFWGGSQFINSKAVGNYEDYLVKELIPAVKKEFPIKEGRTLVMGGSSGGYGALHLSSKFPKQFPYCAAIAPDSHFESCYVGDLQKASSFILGKSYKELKELHSAGKILSRRGDGHSILNAIGMTACYSPKTASQLNFPMDFKTGEIDKAVWRLWKKHDPVIFLNSRKNKVKNLKGIFIEVGVKDQFCLFFGARRMNQLLKSLKIKHHYNEFNGSHWDLSERRPMVLDWINSKWK